MKIAKSDEMHNDLQVFCERYDLDIGGLLNFPPKWLLTKHVRLVGNGLTVEWKPAFFNPIRREKKFYTFRVMLESEQSTFVGGANYGQTGMPMKFDMLLEELGVVIDEIKEHAKQVREVGD